MRRMMTGVVVVAAAMAAALLPHEPALAQAQVTPEQVKNTIDQGVKHLRRSQVFNQRARHGYGMNGLAILAMLHCGVPKNDPDIVRMADLCANPNHFTDNTYQVGCIASALAVVDAKKYRAAIERCADWLIDAQNNDGGWRYKSQGNRKRRGGQESDHSCTQFALLGLRAADDAGVVIPEATWQAAEKYLVDTQMRDGGWSYTSRGQTYGSMSAASLGGLYICGMKMHERSKKCGEYEQNKRIANGLNWLATHFAVAQNPGRGAAYVGYYRYALERVCAFSARKYIGRHDWYAEGAAHLIRTQQGNGSWGDELDTIFNLLFLGKASSKVLIQKLEYDHDAPKPRWNTDFYDADHLAKRVSEELDQKVTWQVIRLTDKVESWLEAPILYITGHGKLVLTEQQRKKVREFCERGGTVVADACCMNKTFDESFRAEIAKVFPKVPLAKLHKDHPVYQAPHKIGKKDLLVWEGITAGCRTAVFYSKKDLSCAWDGNIHEPALSVDEKNAFRIGVNVAAYAMGYKPLKDKLEEVKPRLAGREIKDDGRVARGALVFAQLEHDGDSDPDPPATRAMLHLYAKATGARVDLARVDLDPASPELYKYPLIYMTGHREFEYTEEQVEALRKYIKQGGFFLADACCGFKGFDKSFRGLVKQVFPKNDLARLPLTHKIFHVKYRINAVEYRPILKKE
ncbi:MAG: DUF4159 domain-containing protein, partial [Planctomycetota bacterium]